MSEKDKSSKKKPVYQNWWFWVIVAVVVLGIGAAASDKETDNGSNNGSSSSSASVETSDQKSEQKAEQKTSYKVGETFESDGKQVKVTSVERNLLPANEFDRAEEGNELVKVSVEIVNNSKDKVSYSTSDWKMEDSNGDIKDNRYTTESGEIGYGELSSGGKKSGFIVFEVPKGDSGLKLHYQPTWSFFTKEVIIEL